MPKSKINLTLVTMEGCSHCARTKEILKKIKPDYPGLDIKEFNIASPEGKKMIAKFSIMSNPGIIINDNLFAMGGTTEKDLREKFAEILNEK